MPRHTWGNRGSASPHMSLVPDGTIFTLPVLSPVLHPTHLCLPTARCSHELCHLPRIQPRVQQLVQAMGWTQGGIIINTPAARMAEAPGGTSPQIFALKVPFPNAHKCMGMVQRVKFKACALCSKPSPRQSWGVDG